MAGTDTQILFEPWNMGDALNAAAVALQAPERLILACNTRWHTVIQAAVEGLPAPEFLPVNLEYVHRQRRGRWDLGPLPTFPHRMRVLTSRGDVRDAFAIKRIFPAGSLRCSGWLGFAARRSALLDLPFARGWLEVRNRYRAWADLAGVPWRHLESFYRRTPPLPSFPLVTIHVGAQWQSKQYPHVAALAEAISRTVCVRIVAGPGDPLPADVQETEVRRLVDRELVDAFRASSLVIVNDSGPMHLAALLRRPTLPLCRVSSTELWLPPAVVPLRAATTPKGYRPHSRYMSDQVVDDWFPPQTILQHMEAAAYGNGEATAHVVRR